MQNLEPEDEQTRAHKGKEGKELYQQGLALDKSATDAMTQRVWLHKGLANALMRIPDERENAPGIFRTVIRLCDESLSGNESPRIISMLGWCYFGLGDYETSLSCN